MSGILVLSLYENKIASPRPLSFALLPLLRCSLSFPQFGDPLCHDWREPSLEKWSRKWSLRKKKEKALGVCGLVAQSWRVGKGPSGPTIEYISIGGLNGEDLSQNNEAPRSLDHRGREPFCCITLLSLLLCCVGLFRGQLFLFWMSTQPRSTVGWFPLCGCYYRSLLLLLSVGIMCQVESSNCFVCVLSVAWLIHVCSMYLPPINSHSQYALHV